MFKKLLLLTLFIPILLPAQSVKYLQLDDIDGKPFIFSENLDHDATIIVFWATWCAPCKKEFPALQALKEQYENKSIQIIAISEDSPRSLSKVKMFARSHSYDFKYLVDPNQEVGNDLLVKSVPFTMLVNREGEAVYTKSGYREGDEAELNKALQNLWAE
ncbi:MAG: redoxin domain-containing protein [Caldithrix sp.]|nr:redoxin domain-containing protein [Caldithrix sp.]